MQDIAGAFGRYLREVRMLGGRTIERYVAEARRFAEYVSARPTPLRLVEADKKTIEAFVRRETSRGASPTRSTWNIRLSGIRALFDFLFREEMIAVNPALRIDRQRVPRADRLPLSLDEVLSLVEAAGRHSPEGLGKRNVTIIQVFFHCALRVAEVVSLNLEQVDFENRLFLNVRTKGDKRMSVLFNDVVAEALEAYLAERRELVGDSGEGALFVSRLRRRLSVRQVENLVKDYAEIAGITRTIGPHLLRHSSATELAEFANLRVVQEHCGHASVATTERYIHVNQGQRRRAVDSLGAHWRTSLKRRRNKADSAQGEEKSRM